MTSNCHTHSTWCDGADSPEELIQTAIRAGLTDLGFSSHSPAPFDPECPGIRNEAAYQREIFALKEKYREKITISCGIEQDYFSPLPAAGYDYVIGSVHYLKKNGQLFSVDESPEQLQQALTDYYAGDSLALVRDYYEAVIANVQKNQPKIVGHFDLLLKFNEQNPWIAETSKGYLTIARAALAEVSRMIKQYGGIIEVNTGAMSRGWRRSPYPAGPLLSFLHEHKTPIILTSDAHQKKDLTAYFAETKELLKSIGFSTIYQLQQGEFSQTTL